MPAGPRPPPPRTGSCATASADWLPDRVDRRVIAVGMGDARRCRSSSSAPAALVRLTGSGLGCPTWPQCTAESLVADARDGHPRGHRIRQPDADFVLVGIVALVDRSCSCCGCAARRRDLFCARASCSACTSPLQAIIGGITVLTNLNPYVVGPALRRLGRARLRCRGVLSRRCTPSPVARERAVPRWYAITTHVTTLVLALSILVGILTTGAGPHAGDAAAARNGFDAEFMQHVHSWPGVRTAGADLVVLTIAACGAAPADCGPGSGSARRRVRPDRRRALAGAQRSARTRCRHPHGAGRPHSPPR